MKTIRTTLLAVGLASTVFAQNDQLLRQKKLEAAADAAKKAAAEAATDQTKANVMFDKQTFAFISSQLVSGPPVKGAPYSAEAVNETVQTLADGNRIVQRSSAMQYRDSEGRERREETSAMGAIFISDPVAGTRFTLHPESQTAEKGVATFNWTVPKADSFGVVTADRGGPDTLTVRTAGPGAGVALEGPGQFFYVNTGQITRFGNTGAVKTEQLGNMYIEGVQAQGTRTTATIPAGNIGNERPINIVDERWYSPDLQMTIMTKHSDARTGETTFALKNINRSSPPPNLFEIPSDYTVKARTEGPAIHVERRQ